MLLQWRVVVAIPCRARFHSVCLFRRRLHTRTVARIRNVGLSPPNAGARLIGQSMGAYMALELVKVTSENTAAMAAGAP